MKIETWFQFGVLILIMVLVIVWGISLFKAPKDTHITFEVTGIKEAENATTLVQVHFECIKYCSHNEQYPAECWRQCEKLGKEGC